MSDGMKGDRGDCFTNGFPRIATAEECQVRWGGAAPGQRFRCYLCGYKFKPGDYWRWQYDNDGDGSRAGNFMVCEECDGPHVRAHWKKHVEEFLSEKFWSFRDTADQVEADAFNAGRV